MQRRFTIVELAFQHLHFHAFLLALVISASKTWLLPSNNCNACPAHAQYAPDMVGGIFAKRDVRMAGQWFRMINAGDTHS